MPHDMDRLHELATALRAPGGELNGVAEVIGARMTSPVGEAEREALTEVVSLALLDPTWGLLHGDRDDAVSAARIVAAAIENPIGRTPPESFVEDALLQVHAALAQA